MITNESSIPTILRKIRRLNDMSQEEFANRFGIPRSTYANYEKGLRRVKASFLLDVKREFGVDILKEDETLILKSKEPDKKSEKDVFIEMITKTMEKEDGNNVNITEKDINYLHHQWDCLVENFIKYKKNSIL